MLSTLLWSILVKDLLFIEVEIPYDTMYELWKRIRQLLSSQFRVKRISFRNFILFHVHYLINEAYYSICPYTQCMYVPFGHAICMPRISSGELYIIPRTHTNWSWSCSSSTELLAIEQMYVPEIVALGQQSSSCVILVKDQRVK